MKEFFSNMMTDITKFVGQDEMSKKIRAIENKIAELKRKENALYLAIGKKAIELDGYEKFDEDGKALHETLENIETSEKELADAKEEKTRLDAAEKARREAEKNATTVAGNDTVSNAGATPSVGVTNVASTNSVVSSVEETKETTAQQTENSITNIVVKCPKCGETYNKEISFCQKCGTKIEKENLNVKYCSNCGTENPDNSKFCSKCGNQF